MIKKRRSSTIGEVLRVHFRNVNNLQKGATDPNSLHPNKAVSI